MNCGMAAPLAGLLLPGLAVRFGGRLVNSSVWFMGRLHHMELYLFGKRKAYFSFSKEKKKKVTAPSGAGFSRMELQSSEHLVICRAVFKVPKWLQMLLFLCQPCHTIS